MAPLIAHPIDALSGCLRLPGDKSISHRALILTSLARGQSRVRGLLESEDVMATAAALRQLGASVDRQPDASWLIEGPGLGALSEPSSVLDLGNSGTGARLLMGLVAGHPMTAIFLGDASLQARPMERVAKPLRAMGASVLARQGCRLPLAISGGRPLRPISYRLPVASAQVKSAILLAGLSAPGETRVYEATPTRDHSEIMLRHFGARVRLETGDEGDCITLAGQPQLSACDITVPADPSSAAFAMVAAACLPGSEVQIPGVGLNPRRIGLITTLEEMGAKIALSNQRQVGGEPVADIVVAGAALQGVEVPAERAPLMIDEYPILAVAAAAAEGRTAMYGLAELRVKETDRLAAMASGLTACGVSVDESKDSLVVHGSAGRPKGGAETAIPVHLDHRIAMSFLILGTISQRPVAIDDGASIATSFPGFVALMNGLGARITP